MHKSTSTFRQSSPFTGWVARLATLARQGLGIARRCTIDGRLLRFRGTTLHEAMTENGIDPGGTCRSGRCGRCRVRCRRGGYALLAPGGWAGEGELLACLVVPGSSFEGERLDASVRRKVS